MQRPNTSVKSRSISLNYRMCGKIFVNLRNKNWNITGLAIFLQNLEKTEW